MNSRSLSNGIQHPRHPSLDNLRRNHINGSRSHPQLSSNGPQDGPNRVRFSGDAMDDESPLHLIADIIFGVAAFTSSIGLLTIVVILYVTVRPFSKTTARRLSAQVGTAAFLDAVALLLPNKKIYLTGDSDVPSPVGTSIIVSNHLMDGDWWTLLMLSRCVGLRGNVKVFLRDEILNISNGSSDRTTPPARVNGATTARHTLNNPTSANLVSKSVTFSNRTTSSQSRPHTSPDLRFVATLLHTFLEFPLMNGEDYISDRENLFQLLRSFAEKNGAAAPVHLLLFPEGWSLHNGADRKSVLAKSNEFAKREARPQLKHLLLPKTTGFSASLDSLRESSPVVYDVTMAYRGYDGSLPPQCELSLLSVWSLLRKQYPNQIHVRIKRYSMEEVLQDASWLDKKWGEKDRLLNHFSRHQSFPPDSRGFCRHRIFETRCHSLEGSVVALVRLLLLPCVVPVLIFLSIPILWTVAWTWMAHRAFKLIFPDPNSMCTSSDSSTTGAGETGQTPRSDSVVGTPFLPATPFASPSVSNWRDMLASQSYENDESK